MFVHVRSFAAPQEIPKCEMAPRRCGQDLLSTHRCSLHSVRCLIHSMWSSSAQNRNTEFLLRASGKPIAGGDVLESGSIAVSDRRGAPESAPRAPCRVSSPEPRSGWGQCQSNFPRICRSKSLHPAVGFGCQPLSDVGTCGQVGRHFRRGCARAPAGWCCRRASATRPLRTGTSSAHASRHAKSARARSATFSGR